MKKEEEKLQNKKLLLLVDFNPEKGGIARVGYLLYQHLAPHVTISFFGRTNNGKKVIGCNGNLVLFFLNIFSRLIYDNCKEIYCDHLGKASALILFPSFLVKKFVIFLHDEEAWNRATGRQYLALKRATHLLCNSDYTYQRFINAHPEFKNKTRVCLLAGVPSCFYVLDDVQKSAYNQWFKENPRYCIFVSRLWQKHRYKGYLELIEAFSKLKQEGSYQELKLVVIGRGDDEEFVKNLIKQLLLEGRVFLFNNVNDQDLVHFYNRSEALIFPSSREGFGFVFLEAMFFKKACVGLKGQPAEEIIEDGKSGLLLPDNHPATLLKVLKDLEENPAKFVSMGERGYEIYQMKFTVQHFQNRFQSAISS